MEFDVHMYDRVLNDYFKLEEEKKARLEDAKRRWSLLEAQAMKMQQNNLAAR
jgi:hypothetical protein